MNEISNFCNGACNTKYTYHGPDPWDNPPYTPGGVALNTSTLSMNARQYIGINYNTHNLYGFSEAVGTFPYHSHPINQHTHITSNTY
jgi:lysosomal alpha-glucosidase